MSGSELSPADVAAVIKERPIDMLEHWFKLKAQVTAMVEQERSIRAALFAHFFPDAEADATLSYTLPDGHVLKGKQALTRKVDKAVVTQLRALQVKDLDPGLAVQLNLAAHAPDTLVVEALLLNVDSVLRWEPDLSTKPYKQLTTEQRLLFDRCLTTKPGSITLEVADPPKRASISAEGFTGA